MKLTEQQAALLCSNVDAIMIELQNAVFADGGNATFLSIGAHVGMALQKLQDLRLFVEGRIAEAEQAKPKVTIRTVDDPWSEEDVKEAAAHVIKIIDEERWMKRYGV